MPRKASEDSVQFKFRIKQSLREKLEEAAEARGTSVNQEITERLDSSFNQFWTKTDNPKTNAIVDMLSHVIYAAGRIDTMTFEPALRWYDNAFIFDQVRQAVNHALLAIKPPGPVDDSKVITAPLPSKITEHLGDSFFKNYGEMCARGVLQEMHIIDNHELMEYSKYKILPPELVERARRLKKSLGHIAERIPKESIVKES